MAGKAKADDFAGRFREVVSDPLNLLILRHPEAGHVISGMVRLHNGHLVPLKGPGSYYEDFSQILVFNRGVHEPLEEFAFQTLIGLMPQAPVMIELGAYWAHYSMWMALRRPQARLILIEPDATNLAAGQANFARNGYVGQFVQDTVGSGGFELDAFLSTAGINHVNLLHADIQGAETELLQGAAGTLTAHRIDYLFVSTHSAQLHATVVAELEHHGYGIELSSDPDEHSTSFDGFICATAPGRPPVFRGLPLPLGRTDLERETPAHCLERLIAYLPLVQSAS